jgi:hypothetical protein
MLPHDVIVVEQPLAGRADVYRVFGGRGKPGVSGIEGATGPVQAFEKTSTPLSPSGEALSTSDGASSLGEPLGAKQLAPDWSRKQIVRRLARSREESEEQTPGCR